MDGNGTRTGLPVAGGLAGDWPHDGEPAAATLARLAPTPDELRVLRSFLIDGRLTTDRAPGRAWRPGQPLAPRPAPFRRAGVYSPPTTGSISPKSPSRRR
jgi:hypothetical protein